MSPIGFQSHQSGALCVQLILLLTLRVHVSRAGTYTDATSIFSTLLDKYNYNPQVRPLLDQDQVLYVYVHFDMFSIMEVNDVDQSFKCNGQLGMVWFDEVRGPACSWWCCCRCYRCSSCLSRCCWFLLFLLC